MKTTIALIALAIAGAFFGGCNYRNVEIIKTNAPKAWADAGFEIIGYEGYQIGDFTGAPGGKVWYVVQRKGDPKVRYHGYVTKWGDEYQIYNITALDAITPQ